MGRRIRSLLGSALVIALVAFTAAVLMPEKSYAAVDITTVYRLYNSRSGEHLFTTDTNEYKTLPTYGIGWKQEGVAWASPAKSSTPVYRLYNTVSGDHHYTCDLNEYNTLPRYNWRQEGVAWYSDQNKSVPVYRLFSPGAFVGTHLFTCDRNEYNTLPNYGWKQENIAWYAVSLSDSSDGTVARTPIMGDSTATVDEMVAYFESTGASYPSETYAQYGAETIEEFCSLLVDAANAEGVNAEVLFAQVMLETGNLQFGGQVQPGQCNFGGLGATDGGASGADFSNYGNEAVYTGLLAQAQHLKAYASTEPLNEKCVDPRFSLVTRGKAPYVESLGGGNWASDPNYADKLLSIMDRLH